MIKIIYLLSLILLEIPLFLLVHFLWKHRKENGPTQRLRYILLVGGSLKFLYFVNEIVLAIRSIIRQTNPASWVPITRIILAIALCTFNWYALITIKKIMK